RRAASPGARLAPACESRPTHHRLDQALAADRVREPGDALTLEALPGLARVRVNLLDGHVRELGPAADQHLEAAAEAAPSRASSAGQAPSPPSSRPRRRESPGPRGSPARP